jgi:hypothetical protein
MTVERIQNGFVLASDFKVTRMDRRCQSSAGTRMLEWPFGATR